MLEGRKCPTCGKVYSPSANRCSKGGHQPLVITNTLVGRVLDHRYRIDKVLGVGGMGAVYRSTHLDIGKEFAVKVLHPEMMEFADMFKRFRNEARAAGRLEHDNVVKVTDFGVTEEKLAFLVMELVEGVLLRSLITQTGMDYRRAVGLLTQVCEAVQAAHLKEIIHRDLKPDNIIVQQVGGCERVKVLDFGLAKLRPVDQKDGQQDLRTETGLVMGTPQYMSPEQCKGTRGEELKATSDIYSLGVIAYEMISGRLPFLADNALEYVNKHSQELAPALRFYAPKVPPSVERVVMCALEKDPGARQQSAAEFARALRDAVSEAARHEKGAPPQTENLDDRRTVQITPNKVAPEAAKTLAEPPQTGFAGGVKVQRWAWAAVAMILLASLGYFVIRAIIPPVQPVPGEVIQQSPKITDEYGVMILIPAGTFEMGRDDGDTEERPKHSVRIKAFYLDEREVTNQQYKKFVEVTNYRAPVNWKGGTYAPGETLLPVNYVTWTDAVAYARWAGKRLPIEEEWEYAARGGSKEYLYPWGNEWREGYANVNRPKKRATVGAFEYDKTPFGIYDMAGNVSEWVQSFPRPYPDGLPDEKNRVYRGGNFADEPRTNTFRNADFPDLPEDASERNDYVKRFLPKVGFRCAKDLHK